MFETIIWNEKCILYDKSDLSKIAKYTECIPGIKLQLFHTKNYYKYIQVYVAKRTVSIQVFIFCSSCCSIL